MSDLETLLRELVGGDSDVSLILERWDGRYQVHLIRYGSGTVSQVGPSPVACIRLIADAVGLEALA
jgi:hypothetical protein